MQSGTNTRFSQLLSDLENHLSRHPNQATSKATEYFCLYHQLVEDYHRLAHLHQESLDSQQRLIDFSRKLLDRDSSSNT